MRRIFIVLPTLFVLLCVWMIASENVSASSLTLTRNVSQPSVAVGPLCHHLQVHLQGQQAPQRKCLDALVHNNATPFIGVTGCDNDSLILYWDANLSGDTVCFDGSGSTDLTSYCAPWDKGGCLNSWNDQPSSFQANDVSGGLYSNIGDNGQAEYFSAFASANLDGSGGRLGNDTASSVNLQDYKGLNNLGEIADHFISRCRKGSIRSEFPGEYYNSTLGAIRNDSSARGKKAWKLLNDTRFIKR